MSTAVPPWLDITPSFFMQALESGAALGANIGSQRRQAQQAAQELALRQEALDINSALKELQQQNIMERAAAEQAYKAGLLDLGQSRLEQDAAQKLRDQALREESIQERAKNWSELADIKRSNTETYADLRERMLAQQAANNEVRNALATRGMDLRQSSLDLGSDRLEQSRKPKVTKRINQDTGEVTIEITGDPNDPEYQAVSSSLAPSPTAGAGGTSAPIKILSIRQKG